MKGVVYTSVKYYSNVPRIDTSKVSNSLNLLKREKKCRDAEEPDLSTQAVELKSWYEASLSQDIMACAI
jgi:hypothetical protein